QRGFDFFPYPRLFRSSDWGSIVASRCLRRASTLAYKAATAPSLPIMAETTTFPRHIIFAAALLSGVLLALAVHMLGARFGLDLRSEEHTSELQSRGHL